MTLETIEGKLDVQIEEALKDIANSFKMLANLESLGEDRFDHTDLNIKSLMQFHNIRIRNCLNALLIEVSK